MTFAAGVGPWTTGACPAPLAHDGWSGSREFTPGGLRRLEFRSGHDLENHLAVYYDDKGNIKFENLGATRLLYHAKDEANNRWLESTIDAGEIHTIRGVEAKVWFKRVQQ